MRRPSANQKPSLPKLPAELPEIALGRVASGDTYMDVKVPEWQAGALAAEGLTLDTALLTRATLGGCQFPRLHLNDVRLQHSDLSAAACSQANFNRVEVLDCRLSGFRMLEGKLSDVRFSACKADAAQFPFSQFKNVWFEGCILREANFQGADLKGCVFKDCDLEGAIFYEAKLEGADFRGSKLDGLQAKAGDLAGAIISSNQALEWAIVMAQLLGLKVQDD